MAVLIVIVLSCGILYGGLWTAYYFIIVRPHITESLSEDDSGYYGYFNAYETGVDEQYYDYVIYAPKFGSFIFYCTMSSSVSTDGGSQHNINGSPFDYSMIAEFNIAGNIESYKFNVQPMPLREGYANAALLILDENGELINRDDLTDPEIAIYDDTKAEMTDIIHRTQNVFNINNDQ